MNEANSTIDNMMTDMTVKTTGDVHYDFLVTMVLHHQGVIDMADGELLCDKNQQLKVIAQEIIVDQTQEIAFMRLGARRAGESVALHAPSFQYYLAGARARFETFVGELPPQSVGGPCNACDLCRWRERCEGEWEGPTI